MQIDKLSNKSNGEFFMGRINGYDDIRMVISDIRDIRSFLSGRKFAVIRVSSDFIENDVRVKQFGQKFDLKYVLNMMVDPYMLQIDDGDTSLGRTYLYVKTRSSFSMSFKPAEGVDVLYPSIDELIFMVAGKRLVFSTDFVENRCGIEAVVNRKLQDFVFCLRQENENYLFDVFFNVKVFLQTVSNEISAEQTFMRLCDIRDFDLNGKMLLKIKEEILSRFGDAFILDYSSESEEHNAQYLLSKFHSNRNWDFDPVCILNYRISAFILPCGISAEKAKKLPSDRITRNVKTGTRYVIDSIQADNDICSSLTEFNELLERFMRGIDFA